MKKIKIIAPIGECPSPDKDLQRRLRQLLKGAPISKVFAEIGKWEEIAVRRDRQKERTTKSGRIDGECCSEHLQGAQNTAPLFIFYLAKFDYNK